MIVYRFEKDGIGPYVRRFALGFGTFHRRDPNTKSSKKYARIFNERMKYLNANYDKYVMVHKDKTYLYGTDSKAALRAYFGGSFKELFKAGYRIKRYRVPDDEVVFLGVEVAFPVKYHKLQSLKKIIEKTSHIS